MTFMLKVSNYLLNQRVEVIESTLNELYVYLQLFWVIVVGRESIDRFKMLITITFINTRS